LDKKNNAKSTINGKNKFLYVTKKRKN
jgi:hypothetical protein